MWSPYPGLLKPKSMSTLGSQRPAKLQDPFLCLLGNQAPKAWEVHSLGLSCVHLSTEGAVETPLPSAPP